MKIETLHVEGMSCGHCVSSVKKALEAIGASGEVDLNSKKVQVKYDESKIDLQSIKNAIEEQGYDVI